MAGRQGKGFWSNLFGTGGPQHDRFSLAELQSLHGVLLRTPVVNDNNRDTVVEALRSIAELVIWGDQHDSNMVEYFLTENLLAHFNQILQQRSNRRGNVAMQVLQTLSILIQNLRNQQTVYYLFSNNHINEIVSMRFDFEDDEVLGYYVNLLKTISLKLNEVTVQFFFQATASRPGSSPSTGPRPASFPLYTESIKFVNHRDPMVRTAVKTLTLNVYAISLPAVHQFVCSRPAAAYFYGLAAYISEQCQMLDRLLSSWDVSTAQVAGSVEGCLAEVEDLLSYCNDVLMTDVPQLRALLLECLWQSFLGPVLFWPLIQDDVAAHHIAALTLAQPSGGIGSGTLGGTGCGTGGNAASAAAGGKAAGSKAGAAFSGRAGGAAADGAPARPLQRGSVGPLCSLYVFERLFRAVTDQQLLALLVSALLGGAAVGEQACSSSGMSNSSGGSGSGGACNSEDSTAAAAAAAAATRWRVPSEVLARLQYSPEAYRQALLCMLRGGDAQVAAAAVRVLAALLQSRAASEEQLELIGLLPLRRRKQRQLMKVLVGDSSPWNSLMMLGPAAATASPAEPAADIFHKQQQQQQQHFQQPQEQQQAQQPQEAEVQQQQQRIDPAGAAAGAAGRMGAYNGSGSPGHSNNSSKSMSSDSDSDSCCVRLSIEKANDGSVSVRLHPCGNSHQQQPSFQQPVLGQPEQQQQQEQQHEEQPQRQLQQQSLPQQSQQHQLPSTQQQEQALAAAAAAHAERQFGEVTSALLCLLSSDVLPPISCTTLAWLLSQLLLVGKGGAALSSPQQQALQAAVRRQQAAMQQQLQGVWCDALGPMVAAEWGRSRLAILRSGPGPVHVAVQTWMQAVLVQELAWQQGSAASASAATSAADGGIGKSDATAAAAKQAYLTVQAAVAVAQLQHVLEGGDIATSPPCPAVSEADVRQGEVREQAQIGLAASQRMLCTVCFTRGQERAALFAVEGLPSCVKAGPAPDLSLLKPSVAAQVAAAAPVCLVAETGSKPETALVLSVAPLMGAEAELDERHPRWLHVQVRPPLRGLLKVLQASNPGNALLNMQKHLVSGHWVLCFPDGDRAASAQQHVEEWAHKMRAVYCQLLHPLLSHSSAGEGCETPSLPQFTGLAAPTQAAAGQGLE